MVGTKRKLGAESGKRSTGRIAAALTLLLTLGQGADLGLAAVPASAAHAEAAETVRLLSQNRPMYASSSRGGGTPNLAADGDGATRWESAWQKDPQWIYVDLGAEADISRIEIDWENAYSSAYRIQVSSDELNWRDVYETSQGAGGKEIVKPTEPSKGRYVRLYSTKRSQQAYGVSIWEFRVYGTGGANVDPRPAAANLALHRPVEVSSLEIDEHLNKPENERPQPRDYQAAGATDGDRGTRWASKFETDGWISVDLGESKRIGGVNFDWENSYARAYDILVSDDNEHWKTVYRQLDGSGKKEHVPLYAEGRYVKMQGLARSNGYGYSLFEFEVLEYREGDEQPVYDIPAVPQAEPVQVGSGSYEIGDLSQLEPRSPKFAADDLKAPFPSNDWWQSLLIFNLGESNGVITLPFKSKYTTMGLAVTTPGAGFASSDGGSVNADGDPDLYLNASSIDPSKIRSTVTGYGDYSVDVMLSDDKTPKMQTTFVKGSPYLHSTFEQPDSVVLRAANLTRLYDADGRTIDLEDGGILTADHIGIEITNTDRAPEPQTFHRQYGLFAPPGTTFMKLGDTLKIKFAEGDGYLSLAVLPSADDLPLYYQHGYAFVTDTRVDYRYDEASALVTTDFTATTQLKREGFPNETLAALLPHQWKIAKSALTDLTYPSIRGTLKVHEGNTFTTQDRFGGLVPQFAEPDGSERYSRVELSAYLDLLDADIAGGLMSEDPYWQGKKLHPLAMGVLVSDQIGDTQRRDAYLKTLRGILTDWYTYSPDEPNHSYYFHYSPAWGSIFPYASGFGVNTGLTDHHFTYGYYVFASAVLAQYDESFKQEYGGMVEHLIRDYANPSRTDNLYPWMRNFDPYEGHSWAGGFADNASGNNQEAAGEALFGWVGQFMWGETTGNDAYRDAAIWGFTTEIKAAEQYWFDYDEDNFLPGYTHASAGQVYCSAYAYTTFFSGEPEQIYGIHWLPLGEWMSYYGRDPQKAADLYDGMLADIRKQSGGSAEAERSWQHIIWPFQALSDAEAVLDKWDPSVMQANEIFNAYWFTHAMNALGSRAQDVWSDDPAVTVYRKNGVYAAEVWNPSAEPKTVRFYKEGGKIGSAVVPAKMLAQVDPTKDSTVAPGGQSGIRYLDRAGWTLTASSAPASDPVSNMIDGSLSTRWTSGSAQNPSQWFEVDLGSRQSFDTLFMNSGTSGGDYARGYRVFVSEDGEDWGEPVASGEGRSSGIAVELGAREARYIRVESTASADNWWSVAELRVASFGGGSGGPQQPETPLPGNGPGSRDQWRVTAFAQSGAETPEAMLDGDVSTRWTSGRPQTNGQWITVDLGVPAAIDTVVMNAGSSNGDAANGFRVMLSQDGRSWSNPVAAGRNRDTSVVRATFAPQTARYVKIVQTGESSNWWSIAELDVQLNGTGKLQALIPDGWNLEASSSASGQEPAAVLDGDGGTRWSSGEPQREGQRLTLDFSRPTEFSQILLDSAGSPDDYARGYAVYVSADGVNWGEPVATVQGKSAQTVASFAPQVSRYARIELTASHSQWWSVSGLTVFAPDGGDALPDDGLPTLLERTDWKVTTSMPEREDYPIAAMLDGDVSSRWSSGEKLAADQWIAVDLGEAATFSRVRLDSASAPNDYARAYVVETSADGIDWTPAASGEGSAGGIDALFEAPRTARYVRILQTGTADYWWSVSELNLYR